MDTDTHRFGTWRLIAWAALVALLAGCAAPASGTPARPSPTEPDAPRLPSPTPSATPQPTPLPTEETDTVRFTIVYDNNAYDPTLRTAWGFACWVETPGGTVLFDTGGDGPTLMENLAQLGLDPQEIDVVVLSHIHDDHTGGLNGLLDTGVRPTVYVPAAFPASFQEAVRTRGDLVEVTEPVEILPGIHTTGQVGSAIVEQALVVETAEGLVVVTGCAHPGVAAMMRRARESVAGEVVLVMGGFHLRDGSQAQIEAVIADLQGQGVRSAAPSHCSGDLARRLFAEAFGGPALPAGAGWTVTFVASSER